MIRSKVVLLFLLLALLLRARPAVADEPAKQARFALVIGANQSIDANLAPLKYADDDAARYLELFRLLGARTYLLTRLDENTRRLHPQAAAEAEEPKKAAYDRALAQLTKDVALAAERGVETSVYVVYAGHGNVSDGVGYVTLEDARITGSDLAQAVLRIPATRVHVIVDACSSYFLAYGRGPGGERRPLAGFRQSGLLEDKRVGLLLSTTSTRESHEWEAFQGGVFSHEVRSGLYGGADADGDGVVSYREIAAFVARANAAVPNEKYRPEVFARPPQGSTALLDIKEALGRRLVIDGKHAGHYYLEDARGIRVADVHNAEGHETRLVRPAPSSRAFLRRVEDDAEFDLDATSPVVALADLAPSEPRVRARGAAHESFSLLFRLPFDAEAVDAYREAAPAPEAPRDEPSPSRGRKVSGLAATGLGAVGLAASAYFVVSGAASASGSSANESQADASARNDRIRSANTAAAVTGIAGGVALGAGLVLLLWPSSRVRVSGAPGAASAVYVGTF